jgi:glycerate 2-kinase
VIVNNFNKLAKTEERKLALELVDVGLNAIETQKVIKKAVRVRAKKLYIGKEKFKLANINELFIVGVGKCSLDAAIALEEILGDIITDGIILDIREGKLKKLRVFQGDHPMPSERNISATKEIIKFLSNKTEKDLIVFIVSGGGSTLLCQPENMSHTDEASILKCLFNAGADIKKINTIRKHTSSARGGFLAKHAYPAKVVSLIFSDVPGDDLEFISSGPAIKDTTTAKDAEKIIKDFNIEEASGVKITLIETPKEDKYFKNIKNILVVSNKIALTAMKKYAKKNGYSAKIRAVSLSGEAKEVGLDIIKELHNKKPKTVLLYGGETTVTGKLLGKGGRAQELALSAIQDIRKDELIISIGSDGRDNSNFAGGICDIITKESADTLGLIPGEYLHSNNSYDFFEKTGDYVLTGDTGLNVADFVVAIKSIKK